MDIDLGCGVFLVGPFIDGHLRLVIDGIEVPHLRIFPGTDTIGDFQSRPNPQVWDVVVDGRMLFNVPKDGAAGVFLLVANAMAVAAGFPCLGAEHRMDERFGIPVAGFCISKSGGRYQPGENINKARALRGRHIPR